MSLNVITQRDINVVLEKRFDSSPFIYSNVVVLLLYWREADQDFKGEADSLERLFRDKFHYNAIERFEIPSEDSDSALIDELQSIKKAYVNSRSLTIIHYGGHGDPDDYRPEGQALPSQQCIWAARNSSDTPKLNWSYIQPQLGSWKGSDVLVILDCCFGAQASRSPLPRVIPENVELLAAAAMECLTFAAGPKSFTFTFIKAVESALASNDAPIHISELYHTLTPGGTPLTATPVYFPHGKATIRLQPHSSIAGTKWEQEAETKLVMEMILRGPMDHPILSRLSRWLVKQAPSDVAKMRVTELVHRATAVQDYVLPNASTTHHGSDSKDLQIKTLPQASKSEINSAWTAFNWSLMDNVKKIFYSNRGEAVMHPAVSRPNGDDILSDETKVQLFLQTFEDNVASLASVTERNILSAPDLLEASKLEAAIKDTISKELGLVKALRMRLENIRYESAVQDDSLAIDEHAPSFRPHRASLTAGSLCIEDHPKHGRVLIEYSYYPAEETEIHRNNSRMNHLVKLLRESSEDFHTLACLDWMPLVKQQRYGLIFNNPHPKSHRLITLHEMFARPINKDPRPPRATLAQRFRIALIVGQAMLKWHTVGWVHESVSSLNVVFFHDIENNTVNYSKPFLTGFSFSRVTFQNSTPRQSNSDILRDVYQHPDRQSLTPKVRHEKEHDLYSFGVLLFELGIWDRAPDVFAKLIKENRIDEIRTKLLSRIEYVGCFMGMTYARAMEICLGQEFGVHEDDRVQSKLARAFEHKVLRKLDVGTRLDD